VFAHYGKPDDPEAFGRCSRDIHVPIARHVPGLRSYEVTRGGITTLAGAAPDHPVAVPRFDSVAAVRAALASPGGPATAAGLADFAMCRIENPIAETGTV